MDKKQCKCEKFTKLETDNLILRNAIKALLINAGFTESYYIIYMARLFPKKSPTC